nr:disease resistance protein At4g27190-like [Ziziphus jujuba var. spinosa]
MSETGLSTLTNKKLISISKDAVLDPYNHCLYGKQHRVSFKTFSTRRSELLSLVHSDVCGPLEEKSLGGNKYFLTFIDDTSRKVWVYFLKTKDQVLDHFQEFHTMVEHETGKKLKCLRSDNGVGIAFGNDKNDCKILLTSRSQDVVCNDMDANLNFVLDDLRFDEAKDLFDKIVGDQLIRNPEIQALAIEIVKECAGLPIALETVASALKKKDYPIWSNALRELRRSAPTNIKGMNKNVYSSIKLSYDFLESTEAKSLLLICSLFPEDAVIGTEVWLKYVMGLPELFQSIKNLEEAREKVLALVDILKASSLLLNVGSNMDEIKMHDVVRDVVILIGSEEYNMFCLRNVDELEDNKKLKVATAISLPNFEGDAHQLPKSLECPQLVFFHICNLSFQKNRNFQIPNHFFEAMKELKVLDLTSVCLKPLPSSFEFLKNLHTLFLNNCEIEDVALIGELRNLKILDLSYSKIRNLPGQIGQLTRLQSLGLSYCSKLEVIECNVISNLVHLEELYMFESFTRWDIEYELEEIRHINSRRTKILGQVLCSKKAIFEKIGTN